MKENKNSTNMEKKLVLLISGHPSHHSLSQSIIDLIKENINPNFFEIKEYNAFDFPLTSNIPKENSKPEFNEIAADISRADSVFVVSPMWNFNVTGALKNLLDGAIQSRKHFHFTKIPILNIGFPIGHLKTRLVFTIFTADGPSIYYHLPFMKNNLIYPQVERLFRVCGIHFWRYRRFAICNVRNLNKGQITKRLQKLAKKIAANF